MSRDQEADDIQQLLDHNREWAAQMEQDDPGFFGRLAKQQEPDFLWIGCSDSRVPANQITGVMPGAVFVHRNVANIVMQNDPNCMSVVAFAIRKLRVRHVIVCGHYGCAGVHAAMDDTAVGTVDHWLSGIRDLWEQHRDDLADLDTAAAEARLCELNVQQQVRSLCRTTVMKEAWDRGQAIDVHGWIYGVEDGLLRVLSEPITSSSFARE